jgi:tetratricopeptide (TPR) repeat protein
MGHLYRAWGKYDEAAVWYRRGIELEPDFAGGYIFLGAVLAKSGDLQSAEEQHRKATQCERGCIDEAYLNLGLVLRAQDRYAEAAECLRKSLELDTDGDQDGGTRAALDDVERMLRLLAK